MPSKKNYEIAVILPSMYQFLYEVMEGVLAIRGVRHHCNFRHFLLNEEHDKVDFPKGYQPDGAIVSYNDDSEDRVQWLFGLQIPIVNVFNSTNPIHPSVFTSPESLAKVIVEHFITLQFEEIGVLSTAELTLCDPVSEHIKSLCEQQNVPTWEIPVSDDNNHQDFRKLSTEAPTLKDKLTDRTTRCGIYTTHDARGRLLADYCAELGVSVPDKIGILGRFDSIHARLSTPELSSLAVPAREIGEQAIQLLIGLIEKKVDLNEHIAIDIKEIRVRESTIGKDNTDLAILKARQMIREQSTRGITVDEIVQSMPMARSTFEKRYRALTGAAPAQDIRNFRQNAARELLLTTSLSVEDISLKVGFTDPRPFVVFFKREAGLTPGEFRKTYK